MDNKAYECNLSTDISGVKMRSTEKSNESLHLDEKNLQLIGYISIYTYCIHIRRILVEIKEIFPNRGKTVLYVIAGSHLCSVAHSIIDIGLKFIRPLFCNRK